MNQSPASPASRRIEELDVLRGFAVFGILIANMAQYFLPDLLSDHPVSIVGEAWQDIGAWFLIHALIDNKFLTLFSLLFGVSFALLFEKFAAQKGGGRLLFRRLAALLLFGLLHGLFLYYADILVGYALAAFLLWPLARRSPRTQLITGILLLAVITGPWLYTVSGPGESAADTWPTVMTAKSELADALDNDSASADTERPRFSTGEIAESWDEIQAYRLGPLALSLGERLEHFANILVVMIAYIVWRSLALFLIGAAAYRSGWLRSRTAGDWRRLAYLLLPVGLVGNFAVGFYAYEDLISGESNARSLAVANELSSILLALGYACLIFWIVASGKLRALIDRIGSVGRLALSNYLLQSAVMAIIATHYGLSLFGQLSRAMMILIAVLAFSLQVLLSHAWRQRFRYGPLEWLWRCFTYWSVLSNRTPVNRATD